MDSTTIAIEPLTKSDITALRTADDVYANVYEGRCTLTAKKRVPYGNTDPWAEDKRHDIAVEFSTVAYGEHGGYDSSAKPTTCYTSLYQAESIWRVAKAGDSLRLVWQKGALGSENTRAVGYVGDVLYVEITPKGDGNRAPLRFLASTYYGPNNSARMCR